MLIHIFEKKISAIKAILFLCFLYILPILLVNRPYIDDLGRSIYGYTGWESDGRPLASILMRCVNFGLPLFDISPLALIISIFIFSGVVFLYGKTVFKDNAGCVSSCFALFSIIINPFFIENLSYHYDVLPMTLSLCCIILIFSVGEYFSSWTNFAVSLFLVVSSLSFYQASIGSFFILTIFECVILGAFFDKSFKNIVFALVIRGGQFLLGYLVYKIVVVRHFVKGGYAKKHSETIDFSLNYFDVLKHNIFDLIRYFKYLFSSLPNITIGAFCICILFAVLGLCVASWKKNKNIAIVFFITLSPILAFVFSFIHISILKNPVFSPRVFSSFGVFLFFTLAGVCLLRIKEFFKVLLMLPIISYGFILMYAYSSVSASQMRIDNLILTSLYHDISSLNLGREERKISFSGRMPVSKELQLSASRAPIIEKLVPIYMNNNWWWGGILARRYNMNVAIENMSENNKKYYCNEIPKVSSQDYSIFLDGNKILVVFGNKYCP